MEHFSSPLLGSFVLAAARAQVLYAADTNTPAVDASNSKATDAFGFFSQSLVATTFANISFSKAADASLAKSNGVV